MKKGAISSPSTNKTITQYFSSKKSVKQQIKQQSNQNSLSMSHSRGGITLGKRVIIKVPKGSNKDNDIKKVRIHLAVTEDVMQRVIAKSKPLQEFCKAISLNEEGVGELLIYKFLKGNTLRPWMEKYAPKSVEQLLDKQSATRILNWIKIYTQTRNINQVCDDDDMYLCDNSTSLRDEEIKTILFKEKWRLKGLILHGREGVGKYTTIKCIAQTLNISKHECTNEINKIAYCKELYESIKSHALQRPVETTNTLKKYFKPEEKKCSKIHIIHEVNQIYPEDKKLKFQENIARFVSEAEVPVILTCSESDIPQLPQFMEYDVIRMNDIDTRTIARLVWTVFHIEFNLGRYYKNELVRVEDIEKVLLKHFENAVFVEAFKVQEIEDVIGRLGETKLESVLVFFQQFFLEHGTDLFICFEDLIKSIPLYDKKKKLLENEGGLFIKKQFVKQQPQNIQTIEQIAQQKIIQDLFTASNKIHEHDDDQVIIDTQKQLGKPVQSAKKHQRILISIASKISSKLGWDIKANEIRYLRALEPKQRKLRSRKKTEPAEINLQKILEKYLKKSDALYLVEVAKLQ